MGVRTGWLTSSPVAEVRWFPRNRNGPRVSGWRKRLSSVKDFLPASELRGMRQILTLSLLYAAAIVAHAQSTAFTYQGRLEAGGATFTGLAEMQFTLFGTLTGGVAVATSTPAIASVNVTDGLFGTPLDFGA